MRNILICGLTAIVILCAGCLSVKGIYVCEEAIA